jgi:ppGpp synthetase/RelA/SpoT-type nucleotidyltranferase
MMSKREETMSPEQIEQLLDQHLPAETKDLKGFERWYEPVKWDVMAVATGVYQTVAEELQKAEKSLLASESHVRKQAWSLTGSDGPSLLKSPASVRWKVGRRLWSQSRQGTLLGALSPQALKKMVYGFEDLARFRIVAEYPLDAVRALKAILPGRRKALLGSYPLDGSLRDFVTDIDLRRAGSGHRARQFAVFARREEPRIRVEVQIMTRLQNFWDQRNHPLYEWTRLGGRLPPTLRVNDLALAEALHLMDQQAERNWREFLKARKRPKASKKS